MPAERASMTGAKVHSRSTASSSSFLRLLYALLNGVRELSGYACIDESQDLLLTVGPSSLLTCPLVQSKVQPAPYILPVQGANFLCQVQ